MDNNNNSSNNSTLSLSADLYPVDMGLDVLPSNTCDNNLSISRTTIDNGRNFPYTNTRSNNVNSLHVHSKQINSYYRDSNLNFQTNLGVYLL